MSILTWNYKLLNPQLCFKWGKKNRSFNSRKPVKLHTFCNYLRSFRKILCTQHTRTLLYVHRHGKSPVIGVSNSCNTTKPHRALHRRGLEMFLLHCCCWSVTAHSDIITPAPVWWDLKGWERSWWGLAKFMFCPKYAFVLQLCSMSDSRI